MAVFYSLAEYLFFFVDEWQSAGLRAHEVMWCIGPAGLTKENIREVPTLAGRYDFGFHQTSLRLID